MIDTSGNQQEPLFPVSTKERERMQEEHLDLLLRIAQDTNALKLEQKKRSGAIAELKQKAAKIEGLLRASRPRP